MRSRWISFGFLALLAAAMTVAGTVARAANSDPTPSASPFFVEIRDYRYLPQSITIKPGETVLWRNDDVQAAHTVTSTNNLFDSGNLDRGVQWSYTFTKPGKYSYTCRYHPYMTGTVIVSGGSPAPAAPAAAASYAPTPGAGGY